MSRNRLTGNKIISAVLAAQMGIYMIFAAIPSNAMPDGAVNIGTAEELAEFAKNCTSDSWSRGKTFNLTDNIDLSREDFSPVPTFGGVFNGNGYTISGIRLENRGSYQGVFRYLQEGGKILNLKVEASITPEGTKSCVGGIVGECSGTIDGCSFDGTVSGESLIGGIAGVNAESGEITDCKARGKISGENATGGIVGKNSGFVGGCTNDATVNTVYEEKKSDISDLDTDVDAVIENYKSTEEESKRENLLEHSDTGGIVGCNIGVMEGCVNNAEVGCKHIGYNTGGIAGRQSGYMIGCTNNGFIQGRKDVGGIAGQAEPYILLDASAGKLGDLRNELNRLNTMVNRFIADADNLSDEAKVHLDVISENTKEARDNTQDLLNQGTDFADDNLGEINAQAAILSNTLDKLAPVFDDLESGGENLSEAASGLSDTLEDMDLYFPELDETIDGLCDSLSDISKGAMNLKRAFARLDNARDHLDWAIEHKNTQQIKTALDDMSTAIKNIITAKQTIKKALEDILGSVKSDSEKISASGLDAEKLSESLKGIPESAESAIAAVQTIKDGIDTLILNTDFNFTEFKNAAYNLELSVGYLEEAMGNMATGLDGLAASVEEMSEYLSGYGEDMSAELSEAREGLVKNLDSLSYAIDDIKSATGELGDIVSDLAKEKPLEFVKLGEDFKNTGEALFDSLAGISGGLEDLKNTVSREQKLLSGDMSAINNQFKLVMNLMLDEVDEIKGGFGGLSDKFIDVSEEDLEGAKQGKIDSCRNCGRVEADRNVGGIAGAAAIEYSGDPEDDIKKPDTLNFTYRSRVVIEACVNDGEIVGKKDCVGGIVGQAEIGTVYKCENYAKTESTNGGYVGGIAGKSKASLRKCYVKAGSEGKRYVGGTAGWCSAMSSCYAIAAVGGEESVGALCGEAENRDNLYGNFFVDKGLGGVDGISYADKAEPIEFDRLKDVAGIPKRFISFRVSFVADGESVLEEEVKYGDSIKRLKYPEPPKKRGFFGVWQEPAEDTVTEDITVECEYKPYITVLESEEKDENGKLSRALCEGEFTDKASLHISEGTQKPPRGINTRVYSITLSGTEIGDDDSVKIRILNEDKKGTAAWCLKDGNWEKTKITRRGKYTIVEASGERSTICIEYADAALGLVWLIPLAALAAAFSCIWLRRRRRVKGR